MVQGDSPHQWTSYCRGLRLFNSREYFQCHEEQEEAWIAEIGPPALLASPHFTLFALLRGHQYGALPSGSARGASSESRQTRVSLHLSSDPFFVNCTGESATRPRSQKKPLLRNIPQRQKSETQVPRQIRDFMPRICPVNFVTHPQHAAVTTSKIRDPIPYRLCKLNLRQ